MDDQYIISTLEPKRFEKVTVVIVSIFLMAISSIPILISESIFLKVIFAILILASLLLVIGTLSFKSVISYDKENRILAITKSALIRLSQEKLDVSKSAAVYLTKRSVKVKQQTVDFTLLEIEVSGRVLTIRAGGTLSENKALGEELASILGVKFSGLARET